MQKIIQTFLASIIIALSLKSYEYAAPITFIALTFMPTLSIITESLEVDATDLTAVLILKVLSVAIIPFVTGLTVGVSTENDDSVDHSRFFSLLGLSFLLTAISGAALKDMVPEIAAYSMTATASAMFVIVGIDLGDKIRKRRKACIGNGLDTLITCFLFILVIIVVKISNIYIDAETSPSSSYIASYAS
jgi:hypothetical protein